MQRQFLYATAAALLGGLIAAGPASAGQNADKHTAQQLVDNAVPVVQQMEQDSHFKDLLGRAKGIFIVPSSKEGAFIIGGGGGQGVLLVRNGNGWSAPAFLSYGTITLGAQAGGKAGPVAFLLMTDKAVGDFTQANNFSLNANAGLTIVNYSTKAQAPVGKGDIVVWSNNSGAFVGASVSGTDITQNMDEDHAYYGPQANTLKIVHGQATNASADTLRQALAA